MVFIGSIDFKEMWYRSRGKKLFSPYIVNDSWYVTDGFHEQMIKGHLIDIIQVLHGDFN